ncbi:MAG TPA: hypothetical protein VFH18_05275 [Erysipelotrichaceae bacterium]|nr:hypothetical protein [Erysipelotrichaceae bacterium]
MSSIAYITDKNMIEFHRLNGNSTISFWRPSAGKRFTDFNHGDLLFFLAKGTELKSTGEKGIIGYGRFQHSVQHSFRQMWNQYGSLNGYETTEDFKEAILRVSKDKILPTSLSSLILNEIVFFQAPVYLSELGMRISNNLESFIYLDKDNPEMTVKILLKANEMGVDAWSSAVSPYAPSSSVFDDDLARHIIQYRLSNIPNITTEKETKKQSKYLLEFSKKEDNLQWIDERKQELVRFNEKGLEIISSVSTSKHSLMERLVYELGKFMLIKQMSHDIPNFNQKTLQYTVLIEHEVSDEVKQMFVSSGLNYRYINLDII